MAPPGPFAGVASPEVSCTAELYAALVASGLLDGLCVAGSCAELITCNSCVDMGKCYLLAGRLDLPTIYLYECIGKLGGGISQPTDF